MAAPTESRTPTLHRAKIAQLRVRMEGWRQRRAWLNGKMKKIMERAKKLLTGIGLLMEGPGDDMLRHMYGLKKEIDLSFLTGRELIQVAIGSFQVQFHFDENVAVSVEGEFRYFDGQQEWIWKQEPSSAHVAARTVAMLGASITSFESSEDGTLALTFSNGHRLTVLDSSREYESYDITRPGQTIIV